MTEEQKKKLEQQLWSIANTLRGKMDADQFRDYILGFIFYKYLSEKMLAYANDILAEDGINYLEVPERKPEGRQILQAVKEEAVSELGYFLKPSELFSEVAKRGSSKGKEGASTFVLADLKRILNNIEQSTMGTASEDDFDKLFEDLDLTSTKLGRTEQAKNDVIVKVLSHLNEIDFELYRSDSDVLGDAYEYLIGKFAAGAGKKAGEFYTPREVSTVIARIVTTGKDRLRSVYDPACGSGSLLLRVAREVENADTIEFFGQEMNRTTYNLARMNMLLHGVHYSRFNIRQEDTLEHPQHAENLRFEAVVANPPFSAKWTANVTLETDDRFSQYGRLAPQSKADFAFVQHMLHHLDDNGTMAVILPHGVLFRGGAEGHIREYLIRDKNWLDAVIGLPTNIFYGTAIPTCILVFSKCRKNPGNILFIDASAAFGKAKTQNVLRPEDVDKIVKTYRRRRVEDGFSCTASLEEISQNEYNLNIPRYVDPTQEEERIDLRAVTKALQKIEHRLKDIDGEIGNYCDELRLPVPNGVNLDLLNSYKRGVTQKIFSQEVRFKRDDGSAFPKWKRKKLSEVFSERSERGNDDAELLSVTMSRGVVRADEVERVNQASSDRSNYKTVHPGDIAYNSMRMWQGASGVSQYLGIVSPAYTVITPQEGQLPIFWGYVFKLDSSIALFQRYSQGLTSDTWNLKFPALSAISMMVPDEGEQERIADFLAALDKKIDAVASPVTQSASFKKSVLRKIKG